MANGANPRLRSLHWADYEISTERQRELRAFCWQYAEYKKKVNESADYGPRNSLAVEGARGGLPSNPTETIAIRNIMRCERYERNIKMIDDAAAWAAEQGGFAKCADIMLWYVTHKGATYGRALARYSFVPWCESDFYGVRRVFFYALDWLQNAQRTSENTGFSSD